MSDGKTEKATPKRRQEAREKGQVAKSADLNGAVVLMAGLAALGTAGPTFAASASELLTETLNAAGHPAQLGAHGIHTLITHSGMMLAKTLAPVLGACVIAAVIINVAQVRWKITPKALGPDFKRINPLSGAKNLFGMHGLVDLGKSLLKLGLVGAIVFSAIWPRMQQMSETTGTEAGPLAGQLAGDLHTIAWRGTLAYLLIGVIDYFIQWKRLEKSLKMDKEEVRQEHKQEQSPQEVKQAMRRRAMQASRQRMMQDVPQADVVVTNPTHYAVALKYNADSAAPVVVAKGKDLIAARIREIAKDNNVPLVPDPPLARSLHASVEIGEAIPEQLYQAVARVLAYVYRMSRRSAA